MTLDSEPAPDTPTPDGPPRSGPPDDGRPYGAPDEGRTHDEDETTNDEPHPADDLPVVPARVPLPPGGGWPSLRRPTHWLDTVPEPDGGAAHAGAPAAPRLAPTADSSPAAEGVDPSGTATPADGVAPASADAHPGPWSVAAAPAGLPAPPAPAARAPAGPPDVSSRRATPRGAVGPHAASTSSVPVTPTAGTPEAPERRCPDGPTARRALPRTAFRGLTTPESAAVARATARTARDLPGHTAPDLAASRHLAGRPLAVGPGPGAPAGPRPPGAPPSAGRGPRVRRRRNLLGVLGVLMGVLVLGGGGLAVTQMFGSDDDASYLGQAGTATAPDRAPDVGDAPGVEDEAPDTGGDGDAGEAPGAGDGEAPADSDAGAEEPTRLPALPDREPVLPPDGTAGAMGGELGSPGSGDAAGRLGLGALEVGDCLSAEGLGAVLTAGEGAVAVVPCTEPYQVQVVSAVTVETDTYPGHEELRAVGTDLCERVITADPPAGARGLPVLDVLVTVPSESSFDSGEREVLCLLAAPDDETWLTGSLLDPGTTVG